MHILRKHLVNTGKINLAAQWLKKSSGSILPELVSITNKNQLVEEQCN